MPNEQQEFLKDLEVKEGVDVFEAPLVDTPETKPGETKPAEGEPVKETPEERFNRRERRLMERLKDERESNIAQAARIQAITEAQRFSREATPEVDETIERIYGTNTPEAAEATKLLQKALATVEQKSTARALELFREEQQKAAQAERDAVKELRTMSEDIEDEYNVTFDDQTQKAFFTLLEKLSPKDKEGNIIAYADHRTVWEEYQARTKTAPAANRAKDLASRSMVKTGGSPASTIEQDAAERFLKENGII